ncbi:10-hydroxy-9-(phosphonooxy)octadecanoate phosphatase [Aureococcus anophagefferens]|nr:10-hydroxy-9-(phosphonooxy)octadecanoate phosphatase [Aureococcus anophagefferens]
MASRRATFLFASCLALERSDLQLLALSSTLALSGLGVKFILGPALVDAAPPPASGYDAELAAHVRRCASERRETAFCWMADASRVDGGCSFAARPGLLDGGGAAAAGPALALRFDGGRAWTAEPHTLNASAAFAAKPRLCAFADPSLGPRDVAPAVLVVANDLEYLFRLWPYFVNKILWACVTLLAAYALLNDARADGLYFIDMDAYAPPEAFGVVPPLFAAAHGDGRVDVLFENARDPRTFWHIHGDTFYLRDAPLSRLFLREWITWRCGFKDQYSLWHAVLSLAGRAGCLRYADEIFVNMTYQEALHVDLPRFPNLALSCAGRLAACPERAAALYNMTHQLWRHRGISAKATRAYAYAAGGATREVLVGDVLRADNGTAGDLSPLGLARADAATWLGVVV